MYTCVPVALPSSTGTMCRWLLVGAFSKALGAGANFPCLFPAMEQVNRENRGYVREGHVAAALAVRNAYLLPYARFPSLATSGIPLTSGTRAGVSQWQEHLSASPFLGPFKEVGLGSGIGYFPRGGVLR